MDERGHRPAVALEQGDGPAGPVGGQAGRFTGPVDVAVERVGPLEHDQARVAEDGPQPILELIGLDRLELDDQPAGVDRADLRAELAAEEADRDDAEPLGRSKQPGPRPVAGGVVLEPDLVEPRQRIPDMGLVVDREPAAARRIDIGERAVGQSSALRGVQLWHRT